MQGRDDKGWTIEGQRAIQDLYLQAHENLLKKKLFIEKSKRKYVDRIARGRK